MKDRTYIAIDLKSFYASVECRERSLDPLDTNLVVADESRTDKTICLAVTPSLKSYGISGRGRLFEVRQRVREANALRQRSAPGRKLEGSSYLFSELQENPSLAIDFIIAPPRKDDRSPRQLASAWFHSDRIPQKTPSVKQTLSVSGRAACAAPHKQGNRNLGCRRQEPPAA